jgi:hypothetical protein
MGPSSTDALLGFLEPEKSEGRRAMRPVAATVLADTTTYAWLEPLFALLADEDPGVRTAVYTGIRRVSGVDHQDAAFWAEAPPGAREREARMWLDEARR